MKRLAPILAILLLLGTVTFSQLTPAAVAATAAPAPFEEFEEGEGEGEFEEFEVEDCEEAEEEEEEEEAEEPFEAAEIEELEEEGFEFEEEECGEESSAKKSKPGEAVTAPRACLVHHAESTITTLPGSDRVQLSIHYANYTPGAVSVELKLKDHKGSLGLEHAVKHLGLGGTLRLTTKLSDAVMERAADAPEFDVALRARNTPGFCGELLEQRLRTSKPAGRARVYSTQRDS